VRAVAGPDCELIARIFVCPTADAGLARGIGRRMIAAYLTVPAYAAFHDWLGRGPRFRPMREAWAAGDRKAALAAIDDDLVDELVVHGPPGYCRERVAEYQAAGLDTPVIAIVPAPGVDEAEAVRQLAPA
jgi:alkanesulfonate monooxygenase SsuD/methylene tetrahydromethanopterin reductase-like flavin-dependent oxidoreductase (luciferase family)